MFNGAVSKYPFFKHKQRLKACYGFELIICDPIASPFLNISCMKYS